MLRTRVIPCLLLKGQGLVKTVKFKDPKYVGDPINAIKIFNDKEVDELILLDITATPENRSPNFKMIEQCAAECFMPMAYGGGVRTLDDVRQILQMGVEKVVLNTIALERPEFVREASMEFGAQAIVVAMEVKKNFFGAHQVMTQRGRQSTKLNPVEYAKQMQSFGAGELFVNAVDLDGTQNGYNASLVGSVVSAVELPVIACGGAGSLEDMRSLVHQTGVAALAAGSLFVLKGAHRAVLITYPTQDEIREALG